MGDSERLWEPSCLERGEGVGHGQGGAFVDDRKLRLGAAADDGHDPVAEAKP